MKHIKAIIAYHLIEHAKALLREPAEAGSVQRRVSCPSKTLSCFRDGKWQVDELANLSEKLEREISAIEDAVDASGTAIGDENSHYTTAERIRDITAQRDYFMRECDKARAANR